MQFRNYLIPEHCSFIREGGSLIPKVLIEKDEKYISLDVDLQSSFSRMLMVISPSIQILWVITFLPRGPQNGFFACDKSNGDGEPEKLNATHIIDFTGPTICKQPIYSVS